MYDVPKMRDLIKQARYARCRSRFPVPVILYEGKVTELAHLPEDFLKLVILRVANTVFVIYF